MLRQHYNTALHKFLNCLIAWETRRNTNAFSTSEGDQEFTKHNCRRNQKAQIFLEYLLVIGAVVMIMFAMSMLIKRGTQGMIKVVADQIGDQINAEQNFDDGGFLESSYTR